MEQRNKKVEFIKKFDTYSGKRFDICCDIYTGLMENNPEDRIELLTYACNNFGIRDSDGSFTPPSRGVSENELSQLRETYGRTIDTMLDSLIQRGINTNMTAEVFYENIWNLIIQNTIFSTESEKIFALYYILIDIKIPYYSINSGLKMSNSEFRTVINECEGDIRKTRFILAVEFSQKTMEASNLLDIILSQSDYKKQTVIMAKIISELRDKNKELLDTLVEKIKEEHN